MNWYIDLIWFKDLIQNQDQNLGSPEQQTSTLTVELKANVPTFWEILVCLVMESSVRMSISLSCVY